MTTRLLVVEDDTVIGRSLQQAFEGQGYAADWVTRGGAALQSVAAVPVDLVLLDLGLPDGSGLEVCRRLRAMKADLAIVILTGGVDLSVGPVIALTNSIAATLMTDNPAQVMLVVLLVLVFMGHV